MVASFKTISDSHILKMEAACPSNTSTPSY